jgi:Eco57I restriction-modification methylase
MAFDQTTRNRLQKFVSDARKLLSEEFTQQLQNTYGLDPVTGTIAELNDLPSLSPSEQQTANLLRDTLEHYLAASHNADPYADKALVVAVLDRIVREQAFTVLNRLVALRMAEARQFVMESISQGYQSKGFQLYQRIAGSALGETGQAYRVYLFSVFDELSLDLAVLFDRYSSQGRLFPRETVLLELLDLINHAELELLWAEDETVGWIYQYFNSKEERKKMRDESQAPRNSRELAVRNQFFTPRFVVEFLTDNTLGRIWYEMTKGKTTLVDSCQYLVRRPNEVFLEADQEAPDVEKNVSEAEHELSQEELLQQKVYIQHRPLKDPRDIKMLDPACGSMHFGLYAFDLFEKIYSEAWDLEESNSMGVFVSEDSDENPGGDVRQSLHQVYDSKEDFLGDVPRLIIEHNIHGVDIDPRTVQIAGLSLWLRAQKSWADNAIQPNHRPQIKRSNIVCAEPMPGEKELLKEFTNQIQPRVLGQLVEEIFDKMQLAGEAGTLLKIEEEIQTAIDDAKAQKDEGGHWEQGVLFGEDKQEVPKDTRYNFDGGISDDFWGQAEYLILAELERYAESAAGGGSSQKRLFAADTAKGFAFVDLCRKRFDVLLQNPPFGDPASNSKTYIKEAYPSSSRDIFQAFVEQLINISSDRGLIGTLSARTGFFLGDSKKWRENVIFKNRLSLFADLGLGVLDDALVEVAAYVIEKNDSKNNITFATRHLSTRKKEEALKDDVIKLVFKQGRGSCFVPFEQSLIKYIPEYTFAYWAPQKMISRYPSTVSFKTAVGKIKQGVATADDFRFARLAWEVAPESIGKDNRWARFSKGGEYSPPYDDVHLLIDWGGGYQLSAFKGARFQNIDAMFKPGATYTVRTASAFAAKVLPAHCVFSHNAQTWQNENENLLLASIGYMMCRIPQVFVELGVGGGDIATSGSAARRYTTAVIEGVPAQNIEAISGDDYNVGLVITILRSKLIELSYDETSADFRSLRILDAGSSLNEIASVGKLLTRKSQLLALEASYKLDNIVSEFFQLNDLESKFVDAEVGVHPWSYQSNPSDEILDELVCLNDESLINRAIQLHGAQRYFTKKSYFINRRLEVLSHILEASPKKIADKLDAKLQSFELEEVARCLFSEAIGLFFGRWNIFGLDEGLRDAFDALPNVAPASLSGKNVIRGEYPISICEPGIACSDSASKFDLASNVKLIFDHLKGNSSDSLLAEALEWLSAKDISSYFSNIKGFFSDHLSRYSKSRRQAPIYWPIQTKSGNYTIWLYYHNLNEQSLYTCVNDFIEPKIISVQIDVSNLRNKASRGAQEERELANLIELETELKDFRDEILRVAQFWKPNMNDGVQITAAPLWQLFQHPTWRNKLKATWGKLEKGQFDWTHLAFSIWPERTIRQCLKDRSIAIAHEVEADLWEEVEVPATRGKGTKMMWQPKEMSETELDAYIQQRIARG